jgi:hypothetical protein
VLHWHSESPPVEESLGAVVPERTGSLCVRSFSRVRRRAAYGRSRTLRCDRAIRIAANRPTSAQKPVKQESIELVWCVEGDPVARTVYYFVSPLCLDERARLLHALLVQVVVAGRADAECGDSHWR